VCRSRSLAWGLVALACSAAALADYPRFESRQLHQGRAVWLDNCEGCHAYSIAGAPLAGDADLWAPRIAKGMDALYESALEGFFGPRGTMMPARGGNEALSDDEVRAAVDYMVRLAAVEASSDSH
jgi:cytochrome c5